MPTTRDLVRLQRDYEGKGLQVIAVYGSARTSLRQLRAHVQQKKISYPVLYDEKNQLSKAYGITDRGRRYPATPAFLIGRDGRVVLQRAKIRHWRKGVSSLETRIKEELGK